MVFYFLFYFLCLKNFLKFITKRSTEEENFQLKTIECLKNSTIEGCDYYYEYFNLTYANLTSFTDNLIYNGRESNFKIYFSKKSIK